jgi:hypothetical protein
MSRVTVEEDRTGPAGHALIRVHDAARAQFSPGFRLHRQEWAEAVLGPQGWQVAEVLLNPARATVEGEDLVLGVGPEVCCHVEGGTYQIAVPAAGVNEVVIWPEIATPHTGRGGAFVDPEARTAKTEIGNGNETTRKIEINENTKISEKTEINEDTETKNESKTDRNTETKKKTKTLVWVLTVLGLLLAAGGAFVALHQFKSSESVRSAETHQPPDEALLDQMSVRDLIARNHPDEMFTQAQRRMAKRPEDALLLLEVAGDDRNYGPALVMLAQLYDPNKPRQGGIHEDARQAAKYYRQAFLVGQTAVAADREALRATLTHSKEAGDFAAGLTLQDFWP